MAIGKRLRFEIFKRDGFRCRYCGADASNAKLQVDHVIPRMLGGPDLAFNLATACEACNRGKSATFSGPKVDAFVKWFVAEPRPSFALEALMKWFWQAPDGPVVTGQVVDPTPADLAALMEREPGTVHRAIRWYSWCRLSELAAEDRADSEAAN